MQDQYLPSGTGDDSLDTPVDLNAAQPVQHFAFGGIANPAQNPFLRGSDRKFLEARQKEFDEFERQRLAYNDALTKWQNEVYNPYKTQVDAYNTAAQKYNTEVYDPYKAQVEAYNQALNKYNEEVYNPYAKQYADYEAAVNAWNAGSRESDYTGPAAPTLARKFDMTMPTAPTAFGMTAPTAPEDFKGTAPVLPFKEEDVVAYQRAAAGRAQKDAGQRALALEVVSNPDQFNFGSMSVANRFMAKGGPVEKSAREMMDEVEAPEDEAAFARMLSEVEAGSKMDREAIRAAVEKVAAAGRGGDELLAYLSPESMQALKRMGGAGTINPATGLPEFKGGVIGRIGRSIKKIFGRSDRPQAAVQQDGGAAAPVQPAAQAPQAVEPAQTMPSAADLMKQLDDANAARRAAEEKAAADLAALRTQQEAALKAQQEAAATAQKDAIAAALKADAEARAKAALPLSQAATGMTNRTGTTGTTAATSQATSQAASNDPRVATALSLMYRSHTTGAPTAEFDRMGGYNTVAQLAASAGHSATPQWIANYERSMGLPESEYTKRNRQFLTTSAGMLSTLPGGGTQNPMDPNFVGPRTPAQQQQFNAISLRSPAVQSMGSFSPISAGFANLSTPFAPTPGLGLIQRPTSAGFSPMDPNFLRNLGRYDPVTQRQMIEERERDMGLRPRAPVDPNLPDVSGTFVDMGRVPQPDYTNRGVGAVGDIGGITIRGPATPGPLPSFGSIRSDQARASDPGNFFALSQPAAPGMNPGTVSTPYNPLAMYQGPSPVQAIANNPNLSPGMLGGQQNAGMMTDRLGNRIYAPGTPPAFMFGPPGFAKGGEADINAMRALVDASNMADEADQEEVINTDPVGSAKSMLSDLMAQEKPRPKATGKIGRMPATGGGAETPKEMALQFEALMSQKDIKPKAAKSAQAELRALARSYQLKKAAAENAARGLMSNTLGAPTLEKPTLEQPTLTTRRFAEGGEAKKGQEVEGSDGPSASALLRRLGLAVARGVPQAVTGLVDLAALPLTATGRMKAEDVVGTTDYLTKRGLLPKPQEGLASESAELLSSMASPGGAAKAAVIGMIGPKGIIEAARRSTLFKGPGMTVPQEQFSSAQMLKMLEEQGIDTNRMWLRGKKEDAVKGAPHYDYDTLEYLYNYQKRPDAVEAAMRDSRRSQATQGRTLSRQPGDRSVTKFNTTGGVWLTESPSLAQTYAGERGYVIPVYAPKPDVKLDAKGEQWGDFYRKDKDWKEAFADPKVRLVEVRNIIDAGPHWTKMISPEASEEELRALLTATNLFAKKPFKKRVVNKLTGEPFEFKHGGSVSHAA